MTDTTGTTVPTRPAGQLGMPAQAAPIDRTPTGVALALSAGGVEAAFGWGDLWDIAKPGLGAIADRLLS